MADLVLHLGTLVATLVFFWPSLSGMAREAWASLGDKLRGAAWRDLVTERPNARLLLLVVVGSVPTAAIGVLFRHQLEASFGDIRSIAWHLLITAVVLFATRFVRPTGRDIGKMRVTDALLIGLAQGIAIMPGISRSGATIATGLLLGLDRELAARYSFLLSLPAIVGAFAIEALSAKTPMTSLGPVAVGFAVALVFGLGALAFLMPVVRRGRVYLFAGYLAPLAVVSLWLLP